MKILRFIEIGKAAGEVLEKLTSTDFNDDEIYAILHAAQSLVSLRKMMAKMEEELAKKEPKPFTVN